MKITIFGLAGSGTSTVGKLLAEKLDYQFMSSGNIMRSWGDELGMSIYEFEDKVVKNDADFDVKLDKKVEDFGKQNRDFIFESRLAWYFIPDSFKIFLSCDRDERYTRIQKREGEGIELIEEKNEKRESELIERYKSVYPHIVFPPKNENFDLIVDTKDIFPDDIVDIIFKHLESGEYI